WTGTGTSRVTGGCGSENRSLDSTIYHCGCNGNGLHWLVSETTGLEKLSYNESSQNDLELWIRTDAPPLPVKLSYFEAIPVENEGVRLRWQSTSETNSDFFAVERSSDIHLWEQIGITDAAGTSSGAIDYLFLDQNPTSDISYYRLKQTDMTGGHIYSEIREISGPQKTPVIAYPNPVTSALSVEGDPAELQALRLYNLMGHEMSRLISVTPLTGSSIKLDLSRLPAGVYLVTTPNSVQRIRKE
ncbi:MAG: T9SS C-terminal target domain-containing protein, partial [Bacteroidetes bacterium]